MTPTASTRRQAIVALVAGLPKPAFAQPDRSVSYVLTSNALLEKDRAQRRQIERVASALGGVDALDRVPSSRHSCECSSGES